MGFKKNIWAGLATLRCHKVSLAYSLLPPLCSIPPYPTLMVTITTTTTILLPNNTPQTIDENDKNVAEVKLDFQVVALCPGLICYILLFIIVLSFSLSSPKCFSAVKICYQKKIPTAYTLKTYHLGFQPLLCLTRTFVLLCFASASALSHWDFTSPCFGRLKSLMGVN